MPARVDQAAHDLALLTRGVTLFNQGAYYDSHTCWEDLWLRNASELKLLLQAMIQLAGALHHHGRGHRVGAEALLAASQARLALCPASLCGIDVAALRAAAGRAWLEPPRIVYAPFVEEAFRAYAGTLPGPARKTDWL